MYPGKSFGSGSDFNCFKHVRHFFRKTESTHFHSSVFSVQLKQNRSKILFIYLFSLLIFAWIQMGIPNSDLGKKISVAVADPHLLLCGSGSGIYKMSIWIRIRFGIRILKKKSHTKKFSTKSFKVTLKVHKKLINKINFIYYKRILTFDLPVLNSPMNLYIF